MILPRVAVIKNRTMIALVYDVLDTARAALRKEPVRLAPGHHTLSV
jgi:hypothetical protein